MEKFYKIHFSDKASKPFTDHVLSVINADMPVLKLNATEHYKPFAEEIEGSKMKFPITGDFEKLILEGCRILLKQSVRYNTVGGDFTHILLECPKDYRIDEDKERGAVKYVSIKYSESVKPGYWYEATLYYSNKSYAVKAFRNDCSEDRRYYSQQKQNQ